MRILGKTPPAPGAGSPPLPARTAEQAGQEHQQALEQAVAAQQRIIARVKEITAAWCRQQAEEKALAILEDTEHYPHPVPAMREFKAATLALQDRIQTMTDEGFGLPSMWGHNTGADGTEYSLSPWKERAPREANALEPAWSLLIQQAGDELDALFQEYGFKQWENNEFTQSTRLTGEDFIRDEAIIAATRDYVTAVNQLRALRAEFKQLEETEKRRKAKELWDSF